MNIASTISFILMLLMGLVCFFTGINMEVIFKSSTPIMIFSALAIILGVIVFILGRKDKNNKIQGVLGIIIAVLGLVGFFVVLGMVGVDSEVYPKYTVKLDRAGQTFMVLAIVELIVGIINSILGFSSKNKIENKAIQENNNEDITEKISKLSQLKEQGALTEEEFNQKKQELLKKI